MPRKDVLMAYNYSNPNSKNSASKNSNKPWGPKAEKNIVKVNAQTKKASFVNKMEDTRNGWYSTVKRVPSGYKLTENGAIGYASTGNALLDIHFQTSSLRKKSETEIVNMFRKAYSENPRLALRWLWYTGDVMKGSGERRTFKIIMNDMARNGGEDIVKNLLILLPEYTRWDMYYSLINYNALYPTIRNIFKAQIDSDLKNMKRGKSISLAGKWLKSATSHSPETRRLGLKTCQMLGMTERQYRKTLSSLRKYLDVTERKMSSNNWQAIDYEKVPSKANLVYNKAFLRHDEERRRLFLGAVKTGEAKINASVLYPHEIVHKYSNSSYGWGTSLKNYDDTVEALWKALPNLVKGNETTIVCCDDSGSMTSRVDNKSSVTALEVATALSIYFSERAKGPYRDTYLTFSNTPRVMRFKHNATLHDKLAYAYSHSEVADTNVEKCMDLILETAIKNNCSQDELPNNLVIVSD